MNEQHLEQPLPKLLRLTNQDSCCARFAVARIGYTGWRFPKGSRTFPISGCYWSYNRFAQLLQPYLDLTGSVLRMSILLTVHFRVPHGPHAHQDRHQTTARLQLAAAHVIRRQSLVSGRVQTRPKKEGFFSSGYMYEGSPSPVSSLLPQLPVHTNI